jgi:ubiquinone/menaquinone biosynthesis C-methylase UbiE
MVQRESDSRFTGSIPEVYDRCMVPLVFEPYAEDLAARLASLGPSRVLELAAGTGAVTRRLAQALPGDTRIVATDLNPAMLAKAEAIGTCRPVTWRQADAMELPFEDASFDAIACQFGWMFFPDRAQAFAEAKRVLRPGGVLLFSTWDRIDRNTFADAVSHALADLFPHDPPRFMARIPHGYHDAAVVASDLARGGLSQAPAITVLAANSRAGSAHVPAIAFCQGTPLRNEIEARSASVPEVTDRVAQAMAARFGPGTIEGAMQALIVAVRREA